MSIIILSHLGLGDNLLNIPIVNYLKDKYNNINIVCFNHNLKNLQYFFDNNKIKFITVNNNQEAKNIIKNKEYENMRIMRSGVYTTGSNISSFPMFIYDDINIPRNVMKTHFDVRNTNKAEELYNLVCNMNYIFVSNETSIGTIFDIDIELQKLNIDKNKIFVICSNKNIYDINHKYYDLANQFIYKINDILLLDYKTIIERANTIILCDSSLFIFSILLSLKTNNNYVKIRTNSINWNAFLKFQDYKFKLLQ